MSFPDRFHHFARTVAPALRAAGGWLRHARVKLFILFTALCLTIGEQYPFSDFPMYSSMEDWTYLLYITDENDKPLPLFTSYGMRTSILKKFFNQEARDIARQSKRRMRNVPPEEYAAAGELAIDRILSFRKDMGKNPEWKEIRLYFLGIEIENNELKRTHTLIARRSL